MFQDKPSYLSKSKRAQLAAKKADKNEIKFNETKIKSVEQIDLVSDQQIEKELQIIEKQLDQKQPKPKDQENIIPVQELSPVIAKINKFNYNRLTKLSVIPIEESPPNFPKKLQTGLQAIIDNVAINNTDRQAFKPYTFSLQGSTQELSVRNSNLKDLAALNVGAIDNRNNLPKKLQIQGAKNQKPGKDKQDQFFQKKNRYFQISHEICYKCNKQGHYAKNCIEQNARKCKTCFSKQHDERNCPQICFECGTVGHISNQCPESRHNKCDRCKQRGHTSDYCGVILGDRQKMTNFQTMFTQSDLKKMKCLNEQQHKNQKKPSAHFNCFQYKQWPMPYHQLRKGGLTSKQKPQQRMNDSGYRQSKNEQNKIHLNLHQDEGFLYSKTPALQKLKDLQRREQQRNRNQYQQPYRNIDRRGQRNHYQQPSPYRERAYQRNQYQQPSLYHERIYQRNQRFQPQYYNERYNINQGGHVSSNRGHREQFQQDYLGFNQRSSTNRNKNNGNRQGKNRQVHY